MNTIRYSVIIPTYNGDRKIGDTIESLLRQTISPNKFEIIVVDDASTDATAHVVERYKTSYTRYHIRCIRLQVNQGPAVARNVGIRNACGSILFFTDDDCQAPAMWIENHTTVYTRNPEVVGVGGWYTPLTRELRENRYHLFIHFWHTFMLRDVYGSLEGKDMLFKGRSTFPAINTGNLSVKKYIVAVVGGFDERFKTPSSEDIEFSIRIRRSGFEMYYLPFMVIHHKNFGLLGFARMLRNRIQGRLVHEQIIRLRTGYNYRDPSFLRMWRNFRNYYAALGRKKCSRLPPRVFIIGMLNTFLLYSKIARWYWRKKLDIL